MHIILEVDINVSIVVQREYVLSLYNFGSEYICPRDPAGDGAGNGGSGGH